MQFEDLKNYKEEFSVIEECRLDGKFICENSIEVKMQKAYKLIRLNKTMIIYFYSILAYDLVFDSGFCYFVQEEKNELSSLKYSKQFLDNFIDYIDIHKFMKTLDSSFISENDYIFNISSLEDRLNKDIDLKATADKMSFIKKKATYREFVESLISRLKSDGFIEPFNTKEGKFKLLKSYKYIEDIIEGVTEYD